MIDEQYHAFAESLSAIFWEYDIVEDRWTYVAPQAERILGYAPEEWKNLAWWQERIHPDDRGWVPSLCRQLTEQGLDHAFEYRFISKDGATMWLSDNVTVQMRDNRPVMLRGFMSDITPRKLAEEESRKHQTMLAHIIDSVPQTIFWKDRNSVYLGCNNVFASRAGLDNSEAIIGKTDYDLPWLSEESEAYRADDREVMEQNRTKFHIEEMQQQANGARIWVDTTKVPLIDPSGNVYGVLGVYQDITDGKRAELREKTRMSILEKMASGTALEELLGHMVAFVEQENPESLCSVLLANEAGTHLLHGAAPSLPDFYNKAVNGLKIRYGMGACGTAAYQHKRVIVEDIEGHPFWKGFSAAGEAGLRACWSEPILSSTGELLGTFATYYRIPRSPDREEIALVKSAAHLASIAIGRVRADEKRRNLEEQLQHMQKIEAIGQLTGGIAHDFNNMLTPIFVYAELIKRTFADDDPNMKKMNHLISSAHKAKDITQKLLSFSRKQTLRMVALDLNEVIRSFHELLQSTIRENVAIEVRLANQPAHIFADCGQIEQVLVNLAVNAQDAIEGKGRILIQTGHVLLDDRYVKLHPGMKPGDHIVLTFTDNGCGMGEEILSHLFEPFYTTKEVGSGTGLGLATAYGIIKQHDGYIQVKSREGEGTTFTVYLPEYHGETKLVSTNQAAEPVMDPRSGETVLIVDDNVMLLDMAVELLKLAGYRVLSADGPLKAQAVVRSHGAAPDLLVTDVVMPEMSGPELYEQLKSMYPELPVLFISGYTFDVQLQGDALSEESTFLSKPFTAEQFLSNVQQAMKHVDPLEVT